MQRCGISSIFSVKIKYFEVIMLGNKFTRHNIFFVISGYMRKLLGCNFGRKSNYSYIFIYRGCVS
jgi:hypothetical protein